MWRSLLLLVLTLAGCGKAAPTPHEKYMIAAAEFDRANAKLTQLAAATQDAEFKSLMVNQFFRLSDSLPITIRLPRYVTKGRGADGPFAYLRYREIMPEVIAAREQAKVVESLRQRMNEARAAWLASTRRE